MLFNKREVLFNFDKARRSIRKEGQVFLFEGFMDVIAAWQSGIENGIASMGTSLTNQQIANIERVATEVILCYDGDQAGINATNRGIDLLQEHSRVNLSVVRVPERLDPDDYVRKYGTEAFSNWPCMAEKRCLHSKWTFIVPIAIWPMKRTDRLCPRGLARITACRFFC